MSCLHDELAGRTEETILIDGNVREGGVRPAELRKMVRFTPKWANKVRSQAAMLNTTHYPALHSSLIASAVCSGAVELLLTAQTGCK